MVIDRIYIVPVLSTVKGTTVIASHIIVILAVLTITIIVCYYYSYCSYSYYYDFWQ